MRRWHITLSIAATVVVATAVFVLHHVNQSRLNEVMLAAQKSLSMIAKPDGLKRQVDWPKNKLILFSKETSVLENSIYFKVISRTSRDQTVKMFVVTKNTSWIFSNTITSPSLDIFEKWLVVPTSEQINNMIFTTKKASYVREDISLLPGQSILTSADFVFPYPMAVDFNAEVYLFQRVNRGFDSYSKSVSDSVLVRASDLNTAIVQ